MLESDWPFSTLRLSVQGADLPNSGTIEFPEGPITEDTLAQFAITHDGEANKFHIKHRTTLGEQTAFTIQRETGDVGVGTINPSAKLDVAGSCKLLTGVAINQFSDDVGLVDASSQSVPTQHAVKTYVDTVLLDKAAIGGDPTEDFNAQNLAVGNDLTVGNAMTIGSNLLVSGNLEVQGDVIARDTEHIAGNVSLGNEDADVVTVSGVIRSGHSSGALEVSAGLHTTGSLRVDDSLTVRNNITANQLSVTGSVTTPLTVDTDLAVNGSLQVAGNLTLGGVAVNEVSIDGALTDNSDTAIPTEQAVKTYVDTALADKAALSGATDQDFNAQSLAVSSDLTVGRNLTVVGNLEVQGDVIARDTEHIEGNVSLGNDDGDVITVSGVMRSGHSSGALEVNAGLHTTGPLTVDDSLTVSNAIATNQLSVLGSVTGSLTIDSDLIVSEVRASGTIQANRFEGDGSALTGVGGSQWADGASGGIFYNGGNVGIGTTSPTKTLEVGGEIQASGIIRATNGFRPATNDWEIARNGEDLEIREPEQSNVVWARFKDSTSLHLIGTPNLWVNGNVGIGTTAPKDKLDVHGALRFNGNSNRRVYGASRTGSDSVVLDGRWDELEVKGRVIDWTGTNFHIGYQNDHSNHGLYIGNGKLRTVAIQGNTTLTVGGNVGIGTTNPTAKLDVDGTVVIQRTSQSPRVTIGKRDNTLPPETALMIQNPSSTRATGIFVLGRNETLINIFDGETTFRGPVRFRSSKSGYVVDRCINSSGKTLHSGDIVKLEATPIVRFEGVLDKIPVPKVTLAAQENDSAVIGIVDSEFAPGPDEPDTRTEPDDPTTIPDGGELSVVTLGAYAHCKVDATKAPIQVGDLLTTSNNPGHAQKATATKIGSIIGKALEPLNEGTGSIAVFVNIQ